MSSDITDQFPGVDCSCNHVDCICVAGFILYCAFESGHPDATATWGQFFNMWKWYETKTPKVQESLSKEKALSFLKQYHFEPSDNYPLPKVKGFRLMNDKTIDDKAI